MYPFQSDILKLHFFKFSMTIKSKIDVSCIKNVGSYIMNYNFNQIWIKLPGNFCLNLIQFVLWPLKLFKDTFISANSLIKNVLSLYGNGLEIPPYDNTAGIASLSPYASLFRRRCPLCDSSVYGYCSDKLFHDSCCCHNPNNPYGKYKYSLRTLRLLKVIGI